MHTGSPSVLLVDDDGKNVRTVAKTLIRAGFSVSTVGYAAEAEMILESRSLDALVVFKEAVRKEDVDLIVWARRQQVVNHIVVMSRFRSPFMIEIMLRKGADLVMQRPGDLEKLTKFLSNEVSVPETTESFSGSVEGVDILSYLQFILISGTKTVLEVYSSEGARGRIYVNAGGICHAAIGGLSGEPALYRCLSFKGGSVRSHKWREPDKMTIDKPGEFLLLEAARFRDEAAGA